MWTEKEIAGTVREVAENYDIQPSLVDFTDDVVSYVPGGQLVLSSLANKGDGVAFLTFDNAASATEYHVVANPGSAACSAWLCAIHFPSDFLRSHFAAL